MGRRAVHTKRDGTEVVVASRWSVQRDAAGRPAAVLETNNDITERKIAEAETQRQEKELQLTIDTIPAFVFDSAGWLDHFLTKRGSTTRASPTARPRAWAGAWCTPPRTSIISSRRAAGGMASGEPWESEGRIRSADGQYRWFLNRAAPLRDEQGNIVKWYGSNTDIEDRKRAENALRRNEAYLAEAQRLSLTGSFGWRIDTGEISWSAEAYRIFERDPSIPPIIDFIIERTHPDDRGFLKRLLERVSRSRDNWEVEHRLLMPDGSIKHIHVVAHPLGEASVRWNMSVR